MAPPRVGVAVLSGPVRVLQLYNRRRVWGGEDRMVEALAALLERHGDEVTTWVRDNAELGDGVRGKLRAFGSGVYSPSAARAMRDTLQRVAPDVVHTHNLYPLFSPSVLVECRRRGVPVVAHLHSYLLTCPTTFHLHRGRVCERCHGGREYACVLQNCRGNLAESAGYALRTAVARRLRLFSDNVTFFIAISEFAKRLLVGQGYADEQIVVVPNMVAVPEHAADPSRGEYLAFAGRLSPEKGVDTLLDAARLSGLPVRVAADTADADAVVRRAPRNVTFVGHLDAEHLDAFYRGARALVVPSIWYEPFGLVVAEAMARGIPVIASRIGALPELLDDGGCGLLFEAGNAEDLAAQMARLWSDPEHGRRLGSEGRAKAAREYGAEVYYRRLREVYARAVRRAGRPAEAGGDGGPARPRAAPNITPNVAS